MTHEKKLARIVGGLFIVGTCAGIGSRVLTAPLLGDQFSLSIMSANEAPMLVGALLVLLMAFALAMVPVVLYPLLRRHSEVLALGAVVFRGALEAVAYILVVLTWFGMVTVGRELAEAGVAAMPGLQRTGVLLLAMQDWSSHMVSIVFAVGALMIYWIFFISRLVPRWLSGWGLVGAVLYLTVALLAVVGVADLAPLMAPLAVQEMVMAVWLILRGFNAAVMTSSSHPDRSALSRPIVV